MAVPRGAEGALRGADGETWIRLVAPLLAHHRLLVSPYEILAF